MTKAEELILEIDGKLSYADATGNNESREELLALRKVVSDFNESRKSKEDEI